MLALDGLYRVAAIVAVVAAQPACAPGDGYPRSSVPELDSPAPALFGWTNCAPGDGDCDLCIDDVPAAFDALDPTPARLGFRVAPSTPALRTHGGHFQGAGRSRRHPEYLYLSRSDELAGNGVVLEVVELPSCRGGERAGSNLRADGTPPTTDRIVNDVFYSGAERDRYHHAAGMQVLGDWAVVATEGGGPGCAVVYDLEDPAAPRRRYAVANHPSAGGHAGLASLAKLDRGSYLLMIGGFDSQSFDFFVSDTLARPAWRHLDTWRASEVDYQPSYQNAQIVSQCDGTLYLIATQAEATVANIINPIAGREGWVELIRVGGAPGNQVTLTRIASKHMHCGTGARRTCDLRAAATPYVTPSGELLLYATEHETGGADGTVRMAEFAPRR